MTFKIQHKNKGKKPLGQLFMSMSKGNPETLAIVKELARTARAIDPGCPLGSYGVLESIQRYRLSPDEIVKLYKLCGSDVLVMNALDYAVYWTENAEKQFGVLSMNELKTALKNDFRDLNIPKIVQSVRADHPKFGQYYQP